MNALLLRLVGLFQSVYLRFGADYDQVKAIVTVKLKMDQRRVVREDLVSSKSHQEKPEGTQSLAWALLGYAVLGAVVGAVVLFAPPLLSLAILFAYFIFFTVMTFISDFSTVLLETKNNLILMPRPLTGRTVFAARLTHIALYLLRLYTVLVLAPFWMVWFRLGYLAALGFLFYSFWALALGLFMTNLLYLAVIKWSSEARLRSLIQYFQIVFSVLLMVSIQVIPRMMGRLEGMSFTFEPWMYFLPPMWMAGATEMLYTLQFDGQHLILTVLAIGVPLWAVWGMQRLSGVFTDKLGKMDGGTKEEQAPTQTQKKGALMGFLAQKLTRAGLERSTFQMVWRVTSRDRKYKLRLYPQAAMVLVYIFIFFFQSDRFSLAAQWQALAKTHYYLWIYYLMVILGVALTFVEESDESKASWVFYATPIEQPGAIFLGTLKAILFKHVGLLFVGLSLIFLLIWPLQIVPHLLLAFALFWVRGLLKFLIGSPRLPFSREPNMQETTGQILRTLLQFFLGAVWVAAHYFMLLFQPYWVWVILPFVIGLGFWLESRVRALTWAKVA